MRRAACACDDDIKAFAEWAAKGGQNPREIAYRPARVLMQDFTGVPAVVDLAAMRDAVARAVRRMAHETAIHRADAESTAGPITPLDPGLAADGVDEVLGPQRFLAREAHMEKALAGEVQRFEVETSNPDASRRYAEASYIPDRAADGTVNGFYALFHDVTGRRLAEQALKEAYDTLEQRVEDRTRELSVLNERLRRENELRRDIEIALREASEAAHEANQSKTRFLAAASHDLLQPLNAARLFTSALSQRSHDDRTERAIQRVDSSLQAAEELREEFAPH